MKKVGDRPHLEDGKDSKAGLFPDIGSAQQGWGKLIPSKLRVHNLFYKSRFGRSTEATKIG